MTDQLRKIIRPKPFLIGAEVVFLLLFNVLSIGFYFLSWFYPISLSHKAHYLFWILWLLINHLSLTVIIDSLTHYLTSGYELTKESLIVVKAGWGKRPKSETIHFENIAGINQLNHHKTELLIKHSGQPKICRLLANGNLFCREVKEHFRLYNLNQLSDTDDSSVSSAISLTNSPRFVVMDEDLSPLSENTEQ